MNTDQKRPSNDEGVLMQEIADPGMTRKCFAVTCSIALGDLWIVDWQRVNSAAVRRWGANGLRWINKEALKLMAERKRRQEAVPCHDEEHDLGV